MLKHLALLLTLTALPARAEDAAILAEYWTDSGSLPPEYAWETTVTIREDGTFALKHCKGYETEGPSCKHGRARVPDEALEAIRAAAAESRLVETPARETETPMVGGGLPGGAVYVGGQKVRLLSQPAATDVERVGKVLATIADAIPRRFDRFTNPD